MRNTRPISNTFPIPPTISRFSGSSSAIRRYMSMSSALWWVMNGRAAAPAGMRVEHLGLDLAESAVEQLAADRGDRRGADLEDPPRLLVDDQVEVALAIAGVDVGERPLRHRPQRLRQQLELASPAPTARPRLWSSRCPRRRPSRRGPGARSRSRPPLRRRDRETSSWICPVSSRRSAKIEAAVAADAHRAPGDPHALLVSLPASRSPCFSRISAAVWSRSKRGGYGSIPRSRSASSFSSRCARSSATNPRAPVRPRLLASSRARPGAPRTFTAEASDAIGPAACTR